MPLALPRTAARGSVASPRAGEEGGWSLADLADDFDDGEPEAAPSPAPRQAAPSSYDDGPAFGEDGPADDGGWEPAGGAVRREAGESGRQRSRANHDYTRGDDGTAQVDEAKVDQLLMDRTKARKTGRFDDADDIREELSDMGVRLFDKERVWQAGGSGRSGRQAWRKDRPDTGGAGSRGGFASGAADRRREPGGRERSGDRAPRRDFGPTGHDYSRSDDDDESVPMSVPVEELDRMLAERLQFKLQRDYEAADDMLAQISAVGVQVHDGYKRWRADGSEFPRGAYGRQESARGYSRAEGDVDDQDQEPLDGDAIDALCMERQSAKFEKDYDRADAIRDELKALGVGVDDRRKSWFSLNGSGHGYRRVDDDGGETPFDVNEVNGMISERIKCKRNRDFGRADELQRALRDLGIEMDDRGRSWSYSDPANRWDGEGGW